MSEANWGDDAQTAPKKKSLPTWLWVCGSGCLLMVLLGIGVSVWGYRFVKDSIDPERQWGKAALVLPFDERPATHELIFGMDLGMELFTFRDTETRLVGILMRFDVDKSQEIQSQYMNESFSGGFMGNGTRSDLEKHMVDVQGRELTVLTFYQESGNANSNDPSKPRSGQSAIVDLTRSDDLRPIMLQLVRESDSNERISDDEVRAFLKPFNVGPNR